MKKYKIDKMKNIGNVIFVVEGGRPETGGTELRLLKKIFADILGYEVQELSPMDNIRNFVYLR